MLIRQESFDFGLPGPVRLLYASDLHLGHRWTRLVPGQLLAAVREKKPDIVLLGGDLVDHPGALPALADCVHTLAACSPVGAIAGNHDGRAGISRVRDVVRQAGGRWLPDDPWTGSVVIDAIIRPRRAPGLRILCAHFPSVFPEACAAGYDLVLAGHLHGGQCVLATWRDKLYPAACLGIYELNGDELRICFSAAGFVNRKTPERPGTFVTKKGSPIMLMTLKRQKPAAAKNDERPRADKEQLQGTWKFVSVVEEGKKMKDSAIKDWKLMFKGTMLRMKINPDMGELYRFRLEETTEPKLLDLVDWDTSIGAAPETGFKGVYSIAGDALTICIGQKNTGRPIALESGPSSRCILWTLKRESPKDEPKKDAKKNDDRFSNGRHHDFGRVKPEATLKCDFGFINTSGVRLQLAVTASAACVKGSLNKKVLQPGEEAKLEVTVDARKFSGPKTMLLFLTTQDGKGTETLRFSVTANSEKSERPLQGDFPPFEPLR
jgi:uncharacterized protein